MRKIEATLRWSIGIGLPVLFVALCSSGCPVEKPATRSVVFLNASPWHIYRISRLQVMDGPRVGGHVPQVVLPGIGNYLTESLAPKEFFIAKDLDSALRYQFVVFTTSDESGSAQDSVIRCGIVFEVGLKDGDAFAVVQAQDAGVDEPCFKLTVFGGDRSNPAKVSTGDSNLIQLIPSET